MEQTVRQTLEEDLAFIGQVVKKSLESEGSTWDMTVAGALMLGIASGNNPGMALYMLSVIDPKSGSLITDKDVVAHFPLGFEGDWTATWDEFSKGDQRAVFKR